MENKTGFTHFYHRHAEEPTQLRSFCGSINMVFDIREYGLSINQDDSRHLEFLNETKTAQVALEAARYHRANY